jgi:transposase
MMKPPLEADTFRRIEVITGVGRRRRWSEEQKAAIVAETLEAGAAVSEVAQRHGVSASQVFSWRKAARKQAAAVTAACPAFVPAAIEPGPSTPVRVGCGHLLIEVEIEGAKVRIPPDAAPKTVLAVLEGLSGLPKRRR